MPQPDNLRPGSIPIGRATALRILIVDDHAETARFMCLVLQKRNYAVRSAASIRSAMERAQESPIDVLISDITLPDGSGRELMRRLSAQQPLIGIAISGHGTDADIKASLAAGFVRHLVKPFDFDELLLEIHTRAEQAGLV